MSPEEKPAHDQRRLAAIVFTDVAGYSARMQQDEKGTLILVRSDFARMRVLCEQQGGEVLKSTGDGLLLCFASVVQAVACALQIQTEFAGRGPHALQHRIGIHLGDVFRDGGDVAGDGVNIAARLQTRARPGTICLSQSVYDGVKGKIPLQAEPLGPQSFKNITEPITVYLASPGGTMAPASGVKKSRAGLLVGAVVALSAGLAVVFWPKQPTPNVAAEPATPAASVAEMDRSIAVLPFTNMSDDKENAFFADGVHEDVLTNLANIGDLRVISRTSVMQYRDTTKTIGQVGADLGVAYVLEGSVRRAGNTVRVTGQLIEVRTGGHLWAKSYDRELKDVFAIQSALATEIAGTLHAVLTPRDKARLQRAPTDNVVAYDLYLKAREIIRTETYPISAVARSVPLLESAVQYDPKFAQGWIQLGYTHLRAYTTFERTGARLAQAKAGFDAAEKIDPDSSETIGALGYYYLTKGDNSSAAEQGARLISLYPNHTETFAFRALQARVQGNPMEALANFRKARALDPWNPGLIWSILRTLERRREYAEAETLLRDITPVVPPNNAYQAYLRALIPFHARGDTQAVDKLLAGLPAEAWRSDSNALFAYGHWAFVRGDAKEVIRLWEQTGPNWRFVYGFFDLAAGIALVADGQPGKARPLLEKNRDWLVDRLVTQPENGTRLFNLTMTYALLGDKQGALATRQKAKNLPAALRDTDWDDAVVLAWSGDKDEALAELARNLAAGKGEYSNNVHEIRRNLFLWPLHGDPRFEALLNDPKNNAPPP